MKEFLETLFEGFPSLESIDPRWPSGFVSLYLSHRANQGNLLFLSDNFEKLLILYDEINSLPQDSPMPVLIEGEDWHRKVPADSSSILLALKGSVAEKTVRATLSKISVFLIKEGDELSRDKFLEDLIDYGFKRVGYVELPGEVAWRGSIVDFFFWGDKKPKRVEFFGDRVVSLREFDPESQKSLKKVEKISIPRFNMKSSKPRKIVALKEKIGDNGLRVVPLPNYQGSVDLANREIRRLREEGYRVFFTTPDKWKIERFKELLPVDFLVVDLYQGFIFGNKKVAIFTENQLIGKVPHKKRRFKFSYGQRIEDVDLLSPGDIVVHRDYGIARYLGLKAVDIEGTRYDCMVLQYKDGEVLVPSYNLENVQRYVGGKDELPPLSEIASPTWAKKKAKAVISLMKLARELLEIQAKRKLQQGFSFGEDTLEQKELEAGFPYNETLDQERVIEEVKRDMESDKAMDRLVVGEVGFGKTEVALRAAFKAVMDSKQVAILVPTTILALQHYRTFKERLKGYPVRVEMVSRLKKSKEIKEILRGLKGGGVDIVIGTHRLLKDDIEFYDLGLLIIDEEHRFGVLQKEKIRKKYFTVDTLRMTATPIPRTLYAALGKIVDLSFMETPPQGREEVETIVLPYDEEIIKSAIERELKRHGQIFYVFNRVDSIDEVAQKVRKLAPFARIGVAHGRMKKAELEDAFLQFYKGEIDILVTTAIVESGIDFPRANTLVVERPELFGLAELHQLRGRVGRSTFKAYAYFLMPRKVSKRTLKRLETLLRYHHLGSGLKIALMDMEIRGAGNLLGVEQHGHAKQLGYELYFQLLDEVLRTLREGEPPPKSPQIVLDGFPAFIPSEYIEEPEVRIAFYRKISRSLSIESLVKIEEELIDRFGSIPKEAENLLLVAALGIEGQKEEISKLVVSREKVKLYTPKGLKIYRWEVLFKKWDVINEIFRSRSRVFSN